MCCFGNSDRVMASVELTPTPIFSLPDNKIKSLVFGYVIAVSYLKRTPCGI